MGESDDIRGRLTRRLDALGVWDVQRPPADFSARVLMARDEPPARPRQQWARRSTTLAAFAAGAAAVVLGAWLMWPHATPHANGDVRAEARQTIAVGPRAIAVAENGAALSWAPTRDSGTAVSQPRGRVFYRVDSGATFVVQTPAGDVRVTGTCFSVHVQESKMSDQAKGAATSRTSVSKAAALGAALAAAVTVTVYEGSTVLANDGGEVTIGPGQRGVAAVGERPRLTTEPTERGGRPASTDDEGELVALRAEGRQQLRQIESLQRELAAARGQTPSEPTDATAPRRFGRNGPPMPEGFDYFEPTQEALLEMAECGVVAWDQPPVWADDEQFDPEYLDALKLSPSEAAAMQETFDGFRDDTVARAREFWVELGGDPKAAEAIDPSELLGLVYGRTDRETRERTREQMAMERAGLAERDDGEASATAELLRWDAELGNAFEAALAERLGPQRARELRAARGGWSGKRSTWADLCSER